MIRNWMPVLWAGVLFGCGSTGGAPAGDGGMPVNGGDAATGPSADGPVADGSSGGDDASPSGLDGGSSGPEGGPDGQPPDAGQGQTDAGPTQPYWGEVRLSEAYPPTSLLDSTIDVWMLPSAQAPSTCSTGSCCFVPATPADAGLPAEFSAGTVTFTQTGQIVAAMKYGVQGDAGESYYPEAQFLGTTPWKELMPMQITATGSTVGAFSGTVVPPRYVSGLKPSFDGAYDVYARASQGLTVTWLPEAPGTRIILDLFTVGGPGDVYCYADDSAGTVTVPPSMFTHLSLYATAASSIVSIARMASTQIQAPNANVELVALVFQPTGLHLDP